MANQEKDARKENMNNMRKNRAYQELKREMDQKRRQREKVRLFKDNVGWISIKKHQNTIMNDFDKTLFCPKSYQISVKEGSNQITTLGICFFVYTLKPGCIPPKI